MMSDMEMEELSRASSSHVDTSTSSTYLGNSSAVPMSTTSNSSQSTTIQFEMIPYARPVDDWTCNTDASMRNARSYVTRSAAGRRLSAIEEDEPLPHEVVVGDSDMGSVTGEGLDDLLPEEEEGSEDKSRSHAALWKSRFAELQQFKDEKKHVTVSRTENQNLYHWIYRQQRSYREHCAKSPDGVVDLTHRELQLQALGVEFSPEPRSVSSVSSWEKMFGELQQFNYENEHVKVPQSENKKLYHWIYRQQKSYRECCAKSPDGVVDLTDRQLQLQALGVEFSSQPRKRPRRF